MLQGIVLSGLLSGSTVARAAELLVSAAASLTEALREVGQEFEKQNAGIELSFNFAASGVLRAQIEQGAPADVFVSADQPEMDKLAQAALVGESKIVARGELVLAVPAKDTTSQGFEALSGAAVVHIGMGSPETVPAGRYARQSLEKLGLWAVVEPKAVYGENVRQVLQYLETGAAEAGFVYRTDALKSKGVRVVLGVPADAHDPIVYPAAVVKRSAQAELAGRFVDFLTSETGQKTLAKFGFQPPS